MIHTWMKITWCCFSDCCLHIIISVCLEGDAMRNITIKKFITDYGEEVKELVMNVHQEFGFSYDKKLDNDLDDIDSVYIKSGGEFWVVLCEDKVIGSVALKKILDEEMGEKMAELKRMYVYPEFRGKGVGQKLLDTVILTAKSKKYKRIILDTNERQSAAIKFYEKNGFLLTKRHDEELYYSKTL